MRWSVLILIAVAAGSSTATATVIEWNGHSASDYAVTGANNVKIRATGTFKF